MPLAMRQFRPRQTRRAAPDPDPELLTMDSTALLVIVVALSGGAGWAAGRLLHRRPAGRLLDGLQRTQGLELDACLSSLRPPGPL
jgi:hypothetical protein